jgi:hypothetical protein
MQRAPITSTGFTQFEPLEPRALLCALHTNTRPVELPFTPVEGGTEGPADIVWVNRGQSSDGFADTFGAGAEVARRVMDAVIAAFERMIGSFNYSDGSSNFNLTVEMAGNHNGASAGLGATLEGKPKSGVITMGRGSNGQGSGWFIDPTPDDHVEFMGPIVNAYSGDATPGGPASGLGDFYTVAAAEMTHLLGLYGSALPGWAARTTNTGVPDTAEGGGNGTFWVFQGPSIKHLLTSNNGGPGGQNWGSAIHGAGPGVNVNFGGSTYVGAQDIGNAVYEFSRRYIPSNTFALMFKDAYNYSTVDPAQFGTFYSMRNPTTGQVLVRGGAGSADVITISSSGASSITISVDPLNDVPGTGSLPGAGNLPAFVSTYSISDVNSIVVQAGDGSDTINVNGLPASLPLTINGEIGSDIINLNSVPAGAVVNVNAGSGDDTIALGGGNIVANLLGQITLDGQEGVDTIVFDDSASSGAASYTIETTSFTIGGSAPIGLGGAEGVTLKANAFSNVININGSVFGRPITILAGGGDDTIFVGAGRLSSIPATVTLDGQAGSDSVIVDDSNEPIGQLYFVQATNITRAGFGPLLYSNIESLKLTADAANSAVVVNSTTAATSTTVNGGEGTDVITISDTAAASPVTIEPSEGLDTLNVNNDAVGTAAVRFAGAVTRLGNLQIGAGGTATLPAGGGQALVSEILAINGDGRLDLNDNAMVIDHAGGSPINSIRSLLANGYNNGAWNGAGIMSGAAAADLTQKTALGYAEASDVFGTFPATFAGIEVDDTAVLIRHTFYGDTNLDRQVNLLDFNRLAGAFGSGGYWGQGNFNYDTSIGLPDFNLLAGNFGLTAAAEDET